MSNNSLDCSGLGIGKIVGEGNCGNRLSISESDLDILGLTNVHPTWRLVQAVYGKYEDAVIEILKDKDADYNSYMDAQGGVSKYNLITTAGMLQEYGIVAALFEAGARY